MDQFGNRAAADHVPPPSAMRQLDLREASPANPQAPRHPRLASPREQQTGADLVPFCNPLRYRARCKCLLHNPKLIRRRPPPPTFAVDPNLDLLRKIALKRPLTSLV